MLNLLHRLSELPGVSGAEDAVRDEILSCLPDAYTDARGNVICHREGTGRRVMVCAHMDEVGLLVTRITESGALGFTTVGGIDSRVLPSKRVRVGSVPGVIGIRAIHLQSGDRGKPIPEEDLYIDIGARDKAEAETMVSVGDYVSFDTPFGALGTGFVKGKALDDRVGCAVLLSLLSEHFPVDLYAVFTTGEEIGGLGAACAAASIRPDIALVLEGTTCSDVPDVEKKDHVTTSGGGVCLPIRDGSMIGDRETVDTLSCLADRFSVPWQYKRSTSGGTDGGVIHLAGGGIRTAVLAVPCRYIHSPVSVAATSDINAMYSLVGHYLSKE